MEALVAGMRRVLLYSLSTSGHGAPEDRPDPATRLCDLLDPATNPFVWTPETRERCGVGRWHVPATGFVPASLTAAQALDAYIWYGDEAARLRAVEVQKKREAERRRKIAQADKRVLREQAESEAARHRGDADQAGAGGEGAGEVGAQQRRSNTRRRRHQRMARIAF